MKHTEDICQGLAVFSLTGLNRPLLKDESVRQRPTKHREFESFRLLRISQRKNWQSE